MGFFVTENVVPWRSESNWHRVTLAGFWV